MNTEEELQRLIDEITAHNEAEERQCQLLKASINARISIRTKLIYWLAFIRSKKNEGQ